MAQKAANPGKNKGKSSSVNQVQGKKNLPLWFALGCAVLAFLLYANTLGFSYVLDDFSLIKENLLTQKGISGLPEIFKSSYRSGYYLPDNDLYRPLSKAMFAIEWELAPNSPELSHWVNVLIYASIGFLLYRLLFSITNNNTWLSLVIALLFITHPLHTEVVSNIKSRDELLSFLFFLLMSLASLKYLSGERWWYLVGTGLSFALALLSKESSIVFAVAVPLLVWFFTNTEFKKIGLVGGWFLMIALCFLFLRWKILGAAPGGIQASVMDNLLMATKDRGLQFTTAIALLGLYIKLFFIPHPLVSDYSFNQIALMGWGDWHFILTSIVLLGMVVWGMYEWKKQSLVAYGIVFMAITVALISNVVIFIGTSFGERLMFTPLLGFCLIAGFYSHKLILKNKNIGLVIVTGVLFLFSIKTVSRNLAWKDNYTLHSTDVLLSPNSARAHFYYGNIISQDEYLNKIKDPVLRRATMDTALSEMRWTLRIYPAYADAFHKIGKLYLDLERFDSAGVYYAKALALNPWNSMYLNNYGNVLFHLGKLNEAKDAFEKSLLSNPNQTDALSNLGSVYGTLGQDLLNKNQVEEGRRNLKLAIDAFNKVIGIAPNYAPAYYMAGITFRTLGDEANAKAYIAKANAINPAYH